MTKKTSHGLAPVAGFQLPVASAVRQARLELVADAQADDLLRAGSRVVAVRTDCRACVDQRAVRSTLLAACVLICADQVDVRALREVVVTAEGHLVIRCARVAASLRVDVAHANQHGRRCLVTQVCAADVVLLGRTEARICVRLVLRIAVTQVSRERACYVLHSDRRDADRLGCRVGAVDLVVERAVRRAAVPARRRRRAGRAASQRVAVVGAEVARSHTERTRCERCSARPRLTRTRLAGHAAQSVHAFELETAPHRRGVLDGVVCARGVVVVVDVARRGEGRTEVVVSRQRLNQVDQRIVLTTQRQRTVCVVRHAHIRLTTEHLATLTQLAGIDVEAVFQLEDRLQAAAQVFSTLQAPTVTLKVAACHADLIAVLAGSIDSVVCELDRFIDQTVQRNAALSMCRAGGAQKRQREGRQCESFHPFLHADDWFRCCEKENSSPALSARTGKKRVSPKCDRRRKALYLQRVKDCCCLSNSYSLTEHYCCFADSDGCGLRTLGTDLKVFCNLVV